AGAQRPSGSRAADLAPRQAARPRRARAKDHAQRPRPLPRPIVRPSIVCARVTPQVNRKWVIAMPPYYHCQLGKLDVATAMTVIGNLVSGVPAAGHSELRLTQVPAWQTAIEVMSRVGRTLIQRRPTAAAWELILEYEIPRRQKRPDVILLADDLIFVIEFKA